MRGEGISQRSEIRGQKKEGKGQRDEKSGTSAADPFREFKGERGEEKQPYYIAEPN